MAPRVRNGVKIGEDEITDNFIIAIYERKIRIVKNIIKDLKKSDTKQGTSTLKVNKEKITIKTEPDEPKYIKRRQMELMYSTKEYRRPTESQGLTLEERADFLRLQIAMIDRKMKKM